MIPADRPAFAELMARLDVVYDKTPSAIKANEYWKQLGDIPIDTLRAAVSTHIREARTYPRISDLRQLADRVSGPKVAPQRLALPPAEHEGQPLYHCPHCCDGGWLNADGSDISHVADCGAPARVRACDCKAHNPARQRTKRYASPHSDVRRPW